MIDDRVMYITIGRPKLRRLTARRAYARIDKPGFVDFATKLVERYDPDASVFPGSYAQLRSIFILLGVPAGFADGLSWGSLRLGGASWLYRVTDDSELVQFRGRWASTRMLEIYIQEVGATSILPGLVPAVRRRVELLAAAAPAQLSRAVSGSHY